MGYQLTNPSSGAGQTLDVIGEAGFMFWNKGLITARSPTSAPPAKWKNPSGKLSAPHLTVEPSWFPCAQQIDIDGTDTTEIAIPVLGGDDFIFRQFIVTGVTKAADAGFRFQVRSGPAGTGISLIAPVALTKTLDYEIEEFNSLLPVRLRPSHLFLKVTVANATYFRFTFEAYAQVRVPLAT